tara:strand:+ start:11859 stop:12320 length:462 start_codon:yes stop_codon:yes gene_type:complete
MEPGEPTKPTKPTKPTAAMLDKHARWVSKADEYSLERLISLARDKNHHDIVTQIVSVAQERNSAKGPKTAWVVLSGYKWNRKYQKTMASAAKTGCHGNKTEFMKIQGKLNPFNKNPGARSRIGKGKGGDVRKAKEAAKTFLAAQAMQLLKASS